MPDIRQQLADMLGESAYTITLLEPHDLTAAERAPIPAWWFEALAQPNPAAALGRALDEWNATLPGQLPKFLAYAREHGQGLFLGRQDLDREGHQIVLVYALTDTTGRKPSYCWVGAPPITSIPQHLQELPTQVKALHTHLHDEFRWAVKIGGAMLPLAQIEPVGDYAGPGDLRLVNTDTEPDLTRIATLYVAGSSAIVCAELSDDPDVVNGWIYGGGDLERVDNLWRLLDEWITIRVSRS